ncbi:hypothetical protein M501DRAFT_1006331 [Patellaria atrata CBS 101060]|uniref:Heterokaryon incompatibility domain-containing protein n=1 Tax=Patellaria atrata CBS 101060 TaxID=1346257 RepID=A0A9P4VQG1_9PEZI|nr:hypothetical protein M501DRAFT_1006331 [Patellaria atrata CBS 101060]
MCLNIFAERFFDDGVPLYAILSHTWGPEEVLFQDIEIGTAKAKKSFSKVQGCCNKAKKDEYGYVWIDTCCVDKSSSAELSEAINTMFKSPSVVEFYSLQWCLIGTKSSLKWQISKTTRISLLILEGESCSTCLAAEIMNWASRRKTSRQEDVAYCLRGLFDLTWF